MAVAREIRCDDTGEIKEGDQFFVDIFKVGEKVNVTGTSKGKGFAGVVKRHHFRGGDMTHGAKGWHRRGRAIGCRLFPGHVNRGMKMPGHMGQVRRTVQNLEVVQVREADNVLLIRGAVPGAKGDYVVIREAKKLGRDRVAQLQAQAAARAKAASGKKGGIKAAPAPAAAAAPAKK